MSYNPPQKRARPNSFQYESNNSHNQTPSVPYPNVCLQASTQIVEYLEKLSQYKQNENSHVEIELRLGLYVENTFHSGVTKEFFDEYEHNLASSGKYTCTESDETDYNVENPYYNRITVNNNGTIEALDKTRLQLPLDLPHRFRFDCRISSAKETPFLGSTPITKPTTWTSMRRKSRKQFDKQNSFWFIHLTQVVSCDSAGNPEKTSYEVEYELKDPANLLDKQRRDYAVGELWNMIVSLLGDTVAQLEMHLGEVKEEHVPFLQEACWRMVRPDTLGQGFPGSMPVSFSRRHMTTVQNNSYFLSEKTDGIRYMLMITPRGVFMIGRKFDFYPLVTYRELGVWAKSHGNTLIDGELVRTLPRNEKERPTLTYMIFDVIQFDGQFIGDLPFAQRMQRIGTIVQWHRTEGQKTAPFQMIGKIFYPKEKFETLKEHIKVEGRDRIYDDGKKRRHKTDGFILTPNDAYSPKGTANLFKWKYSDLLSIDFQIVPDNHGTLMLACGGEGDRLIVCRQLELLEEDENKVKQIIESNRLLRRFERDAHNAWLRRPAGAIILEMTYDPAFGVWRYHLERTDKSKPNHITVVFDTMEAIAENITEAEIYYRLVRSPEYDNWDQRNK